MTRMEETLKHAATRVASYLQTVDTKSMTHSQIEDWVFGILKDVHQQYLGSARQRLCDEVQSMKHTIDQAQKKIEFTLEMM